MAERSLFFNSQLIDGEYDREYHAQDFADYFGTVLTSGFLSSDGHMGLSAKVIDGTLTTVVAPGKAIIRGHFYENTDDLILEHEIPEPVEDRIDRIVLRLDLRSVSRFVRLAIKQGVPSDNPSAPPLQRNDFIYELGVATVRVRANTSSLESADLIDTRLDDDVGGIVNSLITVPHEEFRRMWDEFFDGFSNDVEQEWREYLEDVKDLGFTARADFNNHLDDDFMHITKQDYDRWDGFLDTSRGSKHNQTFEVVERRRGDGTLFSTSVLSELDGENNYLTRTYTEYEEDGMTIRKVVVFDITYDNNGDWLMEVKR